VTMETFGRFSKYRDAADLIEPRYGRCGSAGRHRRPDR
jgi:hypothetical protein